MSRYSKVKHEQVCYKKQGDTWRPTVYVAVSMFYDTTYVHGVFTSKRRAETGLKKHAHRNYATEILEVPLNEAGKYF